MKTNSYRFDTMFDKESESKRLDIRAKARLDELIPTLREAGLRENMRVLDVGSGTGRRAIKIANFLKNGEVICIDVSSDLLSQAQEFAKASNQKNIYFNAVDVTSFQSLKTLGQFDFIHIRLVIQHLKNPIIALTNLYKILKPGGSLFIEDTDRDWVNVVPTNKAWELSYKKVKAGQKKSGGDPNSGRKLGLYLSQAGFTDSKVKLIPVYGENPAVEEWLENYVPSFFIHLDSTQRKKAQKIIERMTAQCHKEPMFFYQTWFQAWGRKV